MWLSIIIAMVIVGVVGVRFYHLVFNQMGVNRRYPSPSVAKHRILTIKRNLGGEEIETSFVECHTGRDAWKVLKTWMTYFGATAVGLAFGAIAGLGWMWYDVVFVGGLAALFYSAFWQYCFERNGPRAVVCIMRKGGDILGYVENIDLLVLKYKFGGQQYETVWDPKVPGPQAVNQVMSWDTDVRNKSTLDPITVPNVDLTLNFKIRPLDPSVKYDQQPLYLAMVSYITWNNLLDNIERSIDGFTEMYFRNFEWIELRAELKTIKGDSTFSIRMKDVLNEKFQQAGIEFLGVIIEGFENPKPIQAMAEAEFEGKAAFKKADGLANAKKRESEGLRDFHENVAAGHQKGLEMFKKTIGDGAKAAGVYVNLGRQEADKEMAKSAKHLYMVPSQIEKLEIQSPAESSRSEKSDKEDEGKNKKKKS